MKTAVCISGALRTFSLCAPFIRSFFGDVDYYGSFWSADRNNRETDSAASLLPFKALGYPDQPAFPSGVAVPGTKLILQNPSARPMYLGIQKSFELLCETVSDIAEYDLIFRCRPDLWFQGHVSDFFDRMSEPKVYIPNHSHYHGYCDQFAGGPPHLMKHVFSTYQAITAYDGEERVLNGERILKYWLDRHSVTVAELPFDFKIYRSAFVGMSYHDIPRFSNAYRDKPSNASPSAQTPAAEHRGDSGSLIDLHTGRIEVVRSTAEFLYDERISEHKERFLRLKEDRTARNGHDLRLRAHSGDSKTGSYVLVAAFRAQERRHVWLLLHRRWREQASFGFDAVDAAVSIKHVDNDAFRIRRLASELASGWAYLKAEIEVTIDPKDIEISIHLADDKGNRYYDGDGESAIDIKAVSLSARQKAGS